MEIIENKFIKATINLYGGTLTSIILKSKNTEMVYQIEDGSWPFQDVQIFPLIGKNNFKYNDEIYSNKTRHGFIRESNFEVENKTKDSITLSFESNEKTLSVYPFKFIFKLTYSLNEATIKVASKIINIDNKDIYFHYASHTGLRVQTDKSNINFQGKFKLLPLFCGVINLNNKDFEEFSSIKITKKLFKEKDTLVFKASKNVALKVNTGIDDILFIYNFNAPYFAIWTHSEKGDFVCIEPRWGISNYLGEPEEIYKREAINKLKKNEYKTFSYKITFLSN